MPSIIMIQKWGKSLLGAGTGSFNHTPGAEQSPSRPPGWDPPPRRGTWPPLQERGALGVTRRKIRLNE